MRMKPKIIFVSLVMGMALLAGRVLHADIFLDPSFSGTLIVTSSDGEIKVIQAGEALPKILKNSVLEIINGNFTPSAEKDDSATVSCGNQSASVGGGGSAAITCGEKKGTLKVLKGPIKFIGQDALDVLLEEGKEYPFGHAGDLEKKAPPTADVEDTTGRTAAGDPSVDSRSIQASQSQ